MSTQPLPALKPHCESATESSATVWSLSLITLANSFPITSSKLIPLQLSHIDKSSLLGTGTRVASRHSTGTCFSLHTVPNNNTIKSNNGPPQHFTISGKRPLLPAAFPTLILDNVATTSSLVGGSHISSLVAID